jgi:hypothetical protein
MASSITLVIPAVKDELGQFLPARAAVMIQKLQHCEGEEREITIHEGIRLDHQNAELSLDKQRCKFLQHLFNDVIG